MARKKPAQADQKALNDTAPVTLTEPQEAEAPKAPATPKRVKLRNTKASNGAIGGIANPLAKDAPKWRALGWVDAD